MKRLLTLVCIAALAGCSGASPQGAVSHRSKASLVADDVWGGNDIFCDDPNFDVYCTAMYGPAARAVLLSSSDASSWRCQVGGAQRSINLNDLCLQQCGSPSGG
jgi:hypothetical protein